MIACPPRDLGEPTRGGFHVSTDRSAPVPETAFGRSCHHRVASVGMCHTGSGGFRDSGFVRKGNSGGRQRDPEGDPGGSRPDGAGGHAGRRALALRSDSPLPGRAHHRRRLRQRAHPQRRHGPQDRARRLRGGQRRGALRFRRGGSSRLDPDSPPQSRRAESPFRSAGADLHHGQVPDAGRLRSLGGEKRFRSGPPGRGHRVRHQSGAGAAQEGVGPSGRSRLQPGGELPILRGVPVGLRRRTDAAGRGREVPVGNHGQGLVDLQRRARQCYSLRRRPPAVRVCGGAWGRGQL